MAIHALLGVLLAGTIDVGGTTRTYELYVPAKHAAKMPLVIAFHGHFGTGKGMARLSGFDALADREGFVVVYPDGLGRSWNDGRKTRNGADDVGFTRALIDDLERRYPIDPKRVYATGMSNGAVFSQRLGCELSDRIAAIAPVSGSMPDAIAPACKPSHRVSVLEIAGTADPLMPFDGGNVSGAPVLSAPATAALWARLDGCAPDPLTKSLAPRVADDPTSVERTSYVRCKNGTNVVLYVIHGGGHTWPSGSQYLPKSIIGPVSNQLDASQAIVDFFLAHARR